MIPLAEALAAYPRTLKPLPAETLDLSQALSRVLAAPVCARVDLPLFTQSAVDGYALRSTDGAGPLRLAGAIPAGAAALVALETGAAVRILTGGALPPGADAVARQEVVERRGGAIRLLHPVAAGADTRYRGEELRAGEIIAQAGQRLGSGLLAALAMAGVAQVTVRRRPRIAVLVTGDEVAPLGEPLKAGQIHDANGPLVQAWLRERGYEPPLSYVADRAESVRAALAAALDHADLIVTTGGVSVGDRDYLPAVASELGVEKVFWKVAQKPGKPLWFGTRDAKAVLAMPGNPAAVAVCLAVHAACVLGVLEGLAAAQPEWRRGLLDGAPQADAQRDRLVRMALRYADDGRVLLSNLPRQESHMLSNLAQASALAWLPAREAPVAAGETVRWLPL